ncbi:hypothetical protein [Tropicibacter naphthalenivorans]|uniref:Uncharacterized protein n=1 Tax=Tropicibacter naphthalenivorans TaxID=441103 RepID=A0A0P1G5C6_9RHOB|nr:hypothetical protein [Tropicibacter naphthalenivorans]CUH76859.1 hypothetical protein TRN7648_01162 [Tropicibacter naphthalenivorans]SMC62622.1 hypothetical protein SAMN04488093_102456 [Tropicibacter naphthalenivorans]
MSFGFFSFNCLSFIVSHKSDVCVRISETQEGALKCDLKVLDADKACSLKSFSCDFKDPSLADGLKIDGDDVSGGKCGGKTFGDWGRNSHRDRDEDRDCDRDGGRHGRHDRDDRDHDRHHDDTDRDCGSKFDGGEEGCKETSFTISHPDCALSVQDLCGMDFDLCVTEEGEDDDTVLCAELPEAEETIEFEQSTEEDPADEADDADDADDADEITADDIPYVDMTEDERAAMAQADDNAAEEADLPDFLL